MNFFKKVYTLSEYLKRSKAYAKEIGLKDNNLVGFKVLLDFLNCMWRYGFLTQDYFVIGNGYTLSKYEKQRFFSVRRSDEVQRQVNNPKYVHLLKNKVETLQILKDLVSRNWLYAKDASFEDFVAFVSETPTLIAKPVNGSCGHGMEKHNLKNAKLDDLEKTYNHFVENDMLLEECLKAHDDIYLGTTALSTFRIYTLIDHEGNVNILKAKYRVGTGDAITDTDDGCVAYPISIEYGVIEGPGINEELNSKLYYYHPGCSKLMVGLKIPMWNKAVDTITKAALKIPQLRYVGWDLAITNSSVEIIEGNHNPYHGTFEIMGQERLWWNKIKKII